VSYIHGPRHEGMNNEKPGNENRKLVQTNQSVDLLATVYAESPTFRSFSSAAHSHSPFKLPVHMSAAYELRDCKQKWYLLIAPAAAWDVTHHAPKGPQCPSAIPCHLVCT
jgi:hypothetical protein